MQFADTNRPMSNGMRNALMSRGGISPSFGELIQGQGKTPTNPMLAGLGDLFSPSVQRAGYSPEGTSQLPTQETSEKPYAGHTMWKLEGPTEYKAIRFLPAKGRFQVLIDDNGRRDLVDVEGFMMGGKAFVKLPTGQELELETGE